MVELTILNKTFHMDKEIADFLENYLERINRYIEDNELDSQLYFDIQERITEKLGEFSGELRMKDAVELVNQIGEPEDIFGDEEKLDSFSNNKENFNLYRDPERGIVLGVCRGFGDYFGIDPFWVRFVFILATFFYGISILIYIVVGVILPKKSKSSDYNDSIIRRIKTVVFDVFSSSRKILYFILHVLGFVFYLLLGLFLLGLSVILVFAAGILFNEMTVGSYQIFAYVDDYMKAGLLLSIFSFVTFGIYFLGKTSGKKLIRRKLVVFSVFSFFLGMFFVVYSGFNIVSNYINVYEKEQNISIDVVSGKNYYLKGLDDIAWLGSSYLKMDPVTSRSLYLGKSQDGKMNIQVVNKINAKNQSSADKIFGKLKSINVAENGSGIVFSVKGEGNFEGKVPFTFLWRDIKIDLPSGVKLDMNKAFKETSDKYMRPHFLRNINLEKNTRFFDKDEISLSKNSFCRYSVVSYSEKKDMIKCEMEKKVAKEIKKKKMLYFFERKAFQLESIKQKVSKLDNRYSFAEYILSDLEFLTGYVIRAEYTSRKDGHSLLFDVSLEKGIDDYSIKDIELKEE